MNDTIVYLIRHAETVDENGIRNTNEDSQMINEKEILSVEGEEQAKKLSGNAELKNLDIIWSSSYNWCTVNENVKLVYNKNTILNIKSPCLLKLTFRKNELINLEQID